MVDRHTAGVGARHAARRWRPLLVALAWLAASLVLSADARTQQQRATKPAGVITLSTGYAGRRTSEWTSDRARVLARLEPALRECYDSVLVRHPAAQGTLKLVARVGPSGHVGKVEWRAASALPDELRQCVGAQLTSLSLPPPEGGHAVIRQDVLFMPRLAARGPSNAAVRASPAVAFDADWTEDSAPKMPLAVHSQGGAPSGALIRVLRGQVVECTKARAPPQSVALQLVVGPAGTARDLVVAVTPDRQRVAACLRSAILSRPLPGPREHAWTVTLRFAIREGGVFLERE